MMTKLVMTRKECAEQIYRVANNLLYYTGRVCELADSDERNSELECEINLRQNIQTLVQLLQVMDDLTHNDHGNSDRANLCDPN